MNTQVANERPTHDEAFKAAAALAAKGLKLVRVYGVTLDGVCECRKGADCRNPGKHPVGNEWQNHATTDENTIASWFEDEERPVPNVGVLLGEWSGVIDVEADTEKGRAALKKLGLDQIETPAFQSGRSPHLLFRWEPGLPKKAKVDDVEGIEVRLGNDGAAQTVLPPSWHGSGVARAWLPGRSPEECDLQPLPREFREAIVRNGGSTGKSLARAAGEATAAGKVFHEGEGRHDYLLGAAGRQARKEPNLTSEESIEEIHQIVLALNASRCRPPYPEEEVRRCTNHAIQHTLMARERGLPDLKPNDPNAEQILADQRHPWEKMGLVKNQDNPREFDPGSVELTILHGDPPAYTLSGLRSPSAGLFEVSLSVDEFTSAPKTAKKILAASTDVDVCDPTPDHWRKLWAGSYDEENRVAVKGLRLKLLKTCRHEYPPAEYQRYARLAAWMLNYLRRFKKPEFDEAATEVSGTGQPRWIRGDKDVVLTLGLADAWSKAAEQAKGQITDSEWKSVDKRIRAITGEKSFDKTTRRGQANGKAKGLTIWTDAHIRALEQLAAAQE